MEQWQLKRAIQCSQFASQGQRDYWYKQRLENNEEYKRLDREFKVRLAANKVKRHVTNATSHKGNRVKITRF